MLSIADKKILIFDLDDTLALSRQVLSSEMGEVLKDVLSKKIVAVTSGAQFKQYVEQFLSQLPADTYLENLILLPTSGGQYYRYQNGEWEKLYDESFAPDEKKEIQTALAEALQETGILSEEDTVYGERIEDRNSQITFSGLGQEAPLEKKNLWDHDYAKRAQLVTALEKRLKGVNIHIGGTTSVDITKEGIDKGYGIQQLQKETGIPIKDMVYIGDALYEGGNDTPVIKTGIQTLQVSGPDEVQALLVAM